jgi:hypothetical protein
MDASALADQIEAILANPASLSGVEDVAVKRRLSEAAYKLNLSLEAGGDSIHRITNAVRPPSTRISLRQHTDYAQPLELALSQVGVQTGLWTAMTKEGASSSFTNSELAEQTKVDPILLSKTSHNHHYQGRSLMSFRASPPLLPV